MYALFVLLWLPTFFFGNDIMIVIKCVTWIQRTVAHEHFQKKEPRRWL